MIKIFTTVNFVTCWRVQHEFLLSNSYLALVIMATVRNRRASGI